MDQESNQMEQHPVLCRNGCGFYSNNGTDGLCSVCYKDMIKKKQQPPTGMPASLAPTGSANTHMASLSIEESSPAKTTSVDTAQPTVILPSAQQTEKVSQLIWVLKTREYKRQKVLKISSNCYVEFEVAKINSEEQLASNQENWL